MEIFKSSSLPNSPFSLISSSQIFSYRFEIKIKDALTALESRLLVERTAAVHSLRLEMQAMIDKAHVEKDEFQALYSKVR